MTHQIVLNTIQVVIGILITSSVGYLANKCKTYRLNLKSKEDNEKIQNKALLEIIQKQLNDVYVKGESSKQIYDFEYRNWFNLYDIYQDLGGNDYMHHIADIIKTWEIIPTGIIEK